MATPLDQSPVTDAGLTHLKGLKALTYLGLNRTQITHAGVAEVRNHEVVPATSHRSGCRWCGSGTHADRTPLSQSLYGWRLDTPTEAAAHETSAGFDAGDGRGGVWSRGGCKHS